jgi:hypothetical protein
MGCGLRPGARRPGPGAGPDAAVQKKVKVVKDLFKDEFAKKRRRTSRHSPQLINRGVETASDRPNT